MRQELPRWPCANKVAILFFGLDVREEQLADLRIARLEIDEKVRRGWTVKVTPLLELMEVNS